MAQNIQMPSAKVVISAAASVAATAMLIRSVANDFIPRELRDYISSKLQYFFTTLSNDVVIVIDEFDGLSQNQLYKAAEIYLGSIINPFTKRFRATLPDKEKKINLSMERNEQLVDEFCGFQLKWRMVCREIQPRFVSEPGEYNHRLRSVTCYYELSFHKKHRNQVVEEYLPYVLERSKTAVLQKKALKLYSYDRDYRMMMGSRSGNPWQSVNLDHPATFDTLAMDSDIKEMVMNDLQNFVRRKKLYRKVGKAWKRGYLLFGPPGTGKSSLIAAMANYLHFDVYDLELADIRSNTELRRFLISTANQSILVVEDIDCSIELAKKRQKTSSAPMHPRYYNQEDRVTLSGLLNFVDGLWSSCGDERIIVFTTNHKDKLDPTLLRPGRMDVHIHMSYCTPCGFKLLASNYLGITEHPLFSEVERRMKITKATPAEVGEQLLKHSDREIVLKGLIEFLEEKEKIVEAEACKRIQQVSEAEEVNSEWDENGGTKAEKAVITVEEIKKLLKQQPHDEVQREQELDGVDVILRALIPLLQDKKDRERVQRRQADSGSGAGKILPKFEKTGETKSGNL